MSKLVEICSSENPQNCFRFYGSLGANYNHNLELNYVSRNLHSKNNIISNLPLQLWVGHIYNMTDISIVFLAYNLIIY